MILFRTKDEGELNDIACSVSGEISKEQFLDVYEYAMADPDPYPFLFIDLHKKSEHASMFRIRFDKFIIIPPEVLEDKMLIESRSSSPIPTST